MSRVLVASGVLVWVGATLLLSSWGRATRPSLTERLRPYNPATGGRPRARPSLSVGSVREVLVPLASSCGDRLASLLGAVEPASVRLRRVHSVMDPSAFRLRQAVMSGAALLIGAAVAASTAVPPAMAVLLIAGSPLLVFLAVEQRLARESDRWKRAVALELPVVSEQLAMLVSSGHSLGSALARVVARGHGCIATDLAVVVNRIRQGLSEPDALREWAQLAQVDAVHRLVGVLAMHSESGDLGRLVSAEARQARQDLHRRTVEDIERRAQKVWVPVTVATLVPGVILLAVPFLSALRLFANA